MGERELTDRDRAVLAFEERWGSRHSSAKEVAMLQGLGLRPARYQQVLNAAIDKDAAASEMPALVSRLRRLRERRAQARAARSFVGR